jgi:transposase
MKVLFLLVALMLSSLCFGTTGGAASVSFMTHQSSRIVRVWVPTATRTPPLPSCVTTNGNLYPMSFSVSTDGGKALLAALIAARAAGEPLWLGGSGDCSAEGGLRWTKLHERGGMAALKRPPRFGRPPKLSDAQRAELIEALKTGALAAGFTSELWTLPRIGMLIKERFGVQFSQSSVWRLLQQLGWSVQRPTGRARQRDEVAIRTWKDKRWPAIKKSLRGRAE